MKAVKCIRGSKVVGGRTIVLEAERGSKEKYKNLSRCGPSTNLVKAT